ncbi:MAG: Gfo/Idh/MocA family oxidoreductase [Oscillospiraceae bacterium]|nr:Gfo/Idh/MocA family oxidoreductase [Oscillospiraceae bacterium]
MNQKKIKTAVIGVGMMGNSQIRNCLWKLPQYEVVAICDPYLPNLEACRAMFEERGLPVHCYTDHRDLLAREDCELINIVSPDYTHEEIACDCLKAGKHVRLEKPLAITPEGCVRILKCLEESKTVFQIGLELRYAAPTRKIREWQQRLGEVKMLTCCEFRPPFLKKTGAINDWIVQKRYSGGTLLEKNCHHFDLFNWIADAKPVCVYASGDGKTEYAHTDILDSAFVTVEYENGVRAMLSLCLFAPKKEQGSHLNELELGVLGSKGRMELRGDDVYVWNRADGAEEHWHYARENFEAHSDDIIPSMEELARCIREGGTPLTDIGAAVNSALVSFAAELSAEEHRIVYIRELEEKFGLRYHN